jgi:hypothetical protein
MNTNKKSSIIFSVEFTSSKLFALLLITLGFIVAILSKQWYIFQDCALISAALFGLKTGLEGFNKIAETRK